MTTPRPLKPSRYVVVLGDHAPAPDRHAAQELATHLHRITGSRVPILTPAQARARAHRILVGPGACRAFGHPVPCNLGPEGALLQTRGRDLLLTGSPGAPRGTLYAVFVFLEDILHCRWYTARLIRIPRQNSLRLSRIPRRVITPAFEFRETLQQEAWNTRWASRNRTNGIWEGPPRIGLPPAWGGHHVYCGFVHTFFGLVPPKEHFHDHPEWFSEINGRRVPDQQLCLTQPALRAVLLNRLRTHLRQTPRATIASVSQNDNYGRCQCAACRKSDARYGSPAGTLLEFVNHVAESLAVEFPNVRIDTLAYQYTRTPPRGVRPHPNVIIRLCSFEGDFLHPLTHSNNTDFRRDLEGWLAICKQVYVWDYVTNYAHFVLPHPNWFILGENVRYLARAGVRGLFEQANHQSRGGEMGELRAWLLAKLLWNPRQNDRALIHEFLDAVYGPAAPPIAEYMELVHEAALRTTDFPGSLAMRNSLARTHLCPTPRSGAVLDINAPVDAPWLTPSVLLTSLRLFDHALAAVRANPRQSRAVRLARLPVLYAILLRWSELRAHARTAHIPWSLPASRAEACREFVTACRRFGITHLGEGWSHRTPAWLTRVCHGRIPFAEIP